jgi:predicted 3-demethylubiquinone-9 3-methyltransferase (glyoxalase superfamily)
MNPNKIVPCLWFNTEGGSIVEVTEYYKNVFGKDFQAGSIVSLGNTPSGHTERCEVTIFERKYTFMSTEKEHHPFNDALAFTINCEDQQEIDTFWNYFTQEGKEVQCGWCTDKFGLRWQVLPQNFGALMARPNAFKIMMQQKKIIIEAYLN